MGLSLTFNTNKEECVQIGEDIFIKVYKVNGHIRLYFDCPKHINITRLGPAEFVPSLNQTGDRRKEK